jgi:FkbH-like protein/FkbM family methyltransferase
LITEITPDSQSPLRIVPAPSLETAAELRISLRELPFLADHAFQDMVVLPGSLYIEMALEVHRELGNRAPGVVRNVTFQNPVILSAPDLAEDTFIRIEVRKNDAAYEYTFYEAAGGNGGGPVGHQYAARLEIDREPSGRQALADEAISVEAFRAQAHEAIDAELFYQKLRDNGNQYGPRFQRISSLWRTGNQVLGKISHVSPLKNAGETEVPGTNAGLETGTALLDAMTQMLAPFMMARGRTFVLRAIECVEFTSLEFPDTLWCQAMLLPTAEGDNNRVAGDVRIFDSSGKPCLKLLGVEFSLLERASVQPADLTAPEGNTGLDLVISSNFTADPLEDSLKFWAANFDLSPNIEFAPYDQIFQQLLHAESAFRRNKAGVNIILLQLEKWIAADQDGVSHLCKALDRQRTEQSFGQRKRCFLPNGLEIVHLNQYETDYLYQEIFADECYLKHGIQVPDRATVVDIGANIGMFSLFVMSQCRDPRIYAFEPAPVAYDLLKANFAAYDANAQAFNFGVSDRQGTATFTFYENSSVFSSFHSDEAKDRAAIEAVVRNMLHEGSSVDDAPEGEIAQEDVNELTRDRLRSSTHECRLTTVSDIIRENQLAKIDLLKIDAEKSELEIIRGIADDDWPKIDQIVMEIHDPTGEAVRRIEDLLVQKGYRCSVELEKRLEHSGLFNLFAVQNESLNRPRPVEATRVRQPSVSLERNVRDFCTALESFSGEKSAPVVLCFCPAVEADAELKVAVGDAERELLSRAGAIAGVSTVGSEVLARRYPVAAYYDSHSHQLGDIPYTPECYAAIGTAVFRAIFNLKRKPFKVIVLDCDNTLWQGVCGEDGPRGIAVTEPFRNLQRFMVGEMNAGMLLCLCSKNSERDVLDVFDQRADMLLKREHLASWRINWGSKSENIKSLANELNLGLDSFIFVDDNPVECAEVEINCPGVLALRLPQNQASWPAFFEHIWAFDRGEATEEDRKRARMYQDNARRERFRAQTPSLKDFISGLMVRVEIAETTSGVALAEDQLSRVSQLTFRTNQFNFSGIRRSPGEVRHFLNSENARCLTVRVADRFGDYGLTGVVLYEAEADRLKVDTFLLSCRVLGRGVEHTILAGIGQRALHAGKEFVELTCRPTERNLPARDFASSLGDQYRGTTGDSWLFPAEYLANLQYDPDEMSRRSQISAEDGTSPGHSPAHEEVSGGQGLRSEAELTWETKLVMTGRSGRLQQIGEELYDVGLVAKAIEEFRLRSQGHDSVAEPEPSGSLETIIASIWRRVLGRPGIGLNVNFFEAGGTSLKAVQVIAMIRKATKQNLSIVSLFESPTVSLLAARLSATAGSSSVDPGTLRSAQRGEQRRASLVAARTAMRRARNQ